MGRENGFYLKYIVKLFHISSIYYIDILFYKFKKYANFHKIISGKIRFATIYKIKKIGKHFIENPL
jgi:hypothetical protein